VITQGGRATALSPSSLKENYNNDVSGKFTWSDAYSKIGSDTVASDVEIIEVSTTTSYETATTAKVFPQRLNGITLSQSEILYAHKNSQGQVDKLILTDTTGDMHTYGIVTSAKNNSSTMNVSGSYEYISNGVVSSLMTQNKAFSVSSGQAVKITSDGRSVTSMSALSKAASGKINSVTGSEITVGGKAYIMSDKVQIYVKKSYEYTMITKDEMVDLMGEYSAAIYQDKQYSAGGRVRVIVLS